MARRKWTPKLLISNVEYEISQLQATGQYDQAEGIRKLFRSYLDEEKIKADQRMIEKSIADFESGKPFTWGK